MASTFALVVVLACGGGSDTANTEAPSADDGGEPAAAGEAGVKAHVVLTGGPHAGTYDATPAGSGCLDYQSTSLNGLGIAYYGEPGTKGIASLDFGTKAKVPTAGTTDDFGFTVGIATGDTSALAAMGTSYVVRPKEGRGKGTATVKGSSPRYTVVVSGTTDAGVKVEATLECLK